MVRETHKEAKRWSLWDEDPQLNNKERVVTFANKSKEIQLEGAQICWYSNYLKFYQSQEEGGKLLALARHQLVPATLSVPDHVFKFIVLNKHTFSLFMTSEKRKGVI